MLRSPIMRLPKQKDVFRIACDAVEAGRYGYTFHGNERLDQRIVKLGLAEPDVAFVIKRGNREERKDTWSLTHQNWVYAIRGKTKDGIDLRVCFALEQLSGGHWIVIVTVINLNLKDAQNG